MDAGKCQKITHQHYEMSKAVLPGFNVLHVILLSVTGVLIHSHHCPQFSFYTEAQLLNIYYNERI